MNKSTHQLEADMVQYRDLLKIPIRENHERFVYLDSNLIPNGYLNVFNDMEKITGPRILVRKEVFNRLLKAQKSLTQENPKLTLFVTYGYRNLEIQIKRFMELIQKNKRYFKDPVDLYEEIHRYVAVPTVAGHPAGGAIDITIKEVSKDKFIDFGSQQYNYITKKNYVFHPSISKVAKKNRSLLRKIMMNAGFAPFDGEWWHFSYGDREWAYYKKQKFAFYDQIMYKDIKII